MQTETSHDPLARPVKGRARSVEGRAGPARDGTRPARGPRWRALLEARWRARLQEVTELALAYHDEAAAAGRGSSGGHQARLRLRTLLRQTVASRQGLADTEEALARLSAGNYGRCESCGGAIPAQRLTITPETRYCARCAQEPRLEAPAHRGPPAHADRLAERPARRGQAR